MDSFTILLISIFFFIMGAAVIGLIWYFQRVSRPKKSRNHNTTDPNLSELARLMRNLQTQEMVVKMDGKFFKAAHELSPTQLRRLSLATNVLLKWLDQTSLSPQPMEEPPSELSTPSNEPVTQEFIPPPPEPIPAEPRTGYTPPFAAGSVDEIKPVSTQLPDVVGGFFNPTPKIEPEFKSIASQINDILQVQLVDTDLENRGITVNEGHDRGVMVTLDGNQYQGVMEVPDEDVRRAIRSAVLEWETRK
jgi:hypothetical protein